MVDRAPGRAIVLSALTCLLVVVSSFGCVSDESNSDGSASPTADAPSEKDSDRGGKPEPTRPDPSPTDDPPRDRDDELPGEYTELLRKARDEGVVQVIVRLELDSTPGPPEAKRKAIAGAQQKMFDELEKYQFERGRTYQRWPMFSASVNEAALRHLFSSPDVSRVWESTSARVE